MAAAGARVRERRAAPSGFDASLLLAPTLAGTFGFGLSGGLAGVRARLDVFGAIVVAPAGGILREIGAPPAAFRDRRPLAAAGAAGLVCLLATPGVVAVAPEAGSSSPVFVVVGAVVCLVTRLAGLRRGIDVPIAFGAR